MIFIQYYNLFGTIENKNESMFVECFLDFIGMRDFVLFSGDIEELWEFLICSSILRGSMG